MPWTIALGRPVVPDENRMYSGWSNGTRSKVERWRRRPGIAQQRVHATASGTTPPRRFVAQVRDDDDRLEPGQRVADRGDLGRAVDVAVAVPVPVDGEQHPRLDLGQPVDDGPDAELRRARRPDGAQRRGREQRDDRLGDVGQERGHPIATPDAEGGEPRPAARDAVAQLVRREAPSAARLRHADDDLVRRRRARAGPARARRSSERRRGTSWRRACGRPRGRAGTAGPRGGRTPKWSQTDCQNAPGSSTDHRHAAS